METFYDSKKVSNPFDEISLPSEQACVPVELCKQYTYCVSGNVSALQTLLEIYECEASLALELCLQWVTHASWLTAYERHTIEKLYKICLLLLKDKESKKHHQLAMRILLVGWPYFATDATKQVEII